MGPYNNMIDRKITHFIGSPLISFNPVHKGESSVDATTVSGCPPDHQESWSLVSYEDNKSIISFDRYLGFVTEPTVCCNLPVQTPIDSNDPVAYLRAVDLISESGFPNYKLARIPLTSSFDCEYLEPQMVDYHDKVVLDYIKFGFPLGIEHRSSIVSNASDNHSSARAYSDEVSSFVRDELAFEALLGPFDTIPHTLFTWSPLMTRPKGSGRRVILDLSYREGSVNSATNRDLFDDKPFKLKLPSLDQLIPILEELGPEARLWKIDVSRAFRNVRIDPRNAIHLGMMWQNKYYIDKNLAFGAIHGTAIFERITNLIRFILAKQGIKIFNYIDDIYACCHKDIANEAFEALTLVIEQVGLSINPSKVFPPTTVLPIMGIVVNVNERTFSIPEDKLHEIWCLCNEMFLRDRITKRELQTLLGKLLYISRCVRGARMYINRLLALLRSHHTHTHITPDEGFYLDLCWFIAFLKHFNGVVTFRKQSVSEMVFVDATLTGIGGSWGKRAYSTSIPSEISREVAISQLELYNIVVAMRLWAAAWENKAVCIRCDNESAVSVCNSGRTKDAFMNLCLHNLWLLISRYNIDFRVVHIRGRDNDLADALSRNKLRLVGDVELETVSDECLSLLL